LIQAGRIPKSRISEMRFVLLYRTPPARVKPLELPGRLWYNQKDYSPLDGPAAGREGSEWA